MSQYDGYAAQGISGGGVASLTPWTEPIDGAGFSLTNAIFPGVSPNEFEDDGLQIQNPADTFKFTIQAPAIVADRILNLPLTTVSATLAALEQDQTWLGLQTFPNSRLLLRNPADTFSFSFLAAAIVADRSVTIPLLTGNDVFVMEAFAQTLTNKTIDGDLNTILDINETQMDVSVGVSGTVLTSNGVGIPPTYQATSGGEFVGPWTANHDAGAFNLLNVNFLEINNVANTFQYIIQGSAIAADRNATLPLLAQDDTFIFLSLAQNLTNKTFVGGASANKFQDDGLLIQNPANTFDYTIVASAIAADRNATLPLLTANDTFAMIGFLNVFTALQRFDGELTVNGAQLGANELTVNIDDLDITNGLVVRNASADGSLRFGNITPVTGRFGPVIEGIASSDSPINGGLTLISEIDPAQDSGGEAVALWLIRQDDDTPITTRPLWEMRNFTTAVYQIDFDGRHDFLGNDLDNIQNLIHDLSTSGTDVDFAEDELQEISIAANTVFTGTGYAIGKSKVLKITTDGTLRTLTFPAGWVFVGAKPADQAASKIGILSLTSFTAVEAGVVASYAVEA